MKRAMLCALVGGFALGGVKGPRALAQDELSCGIDEALASKYVWRGLVLTDDPALQPGCNVAWRGVSFSFWGNMDLGDANDNAGEFNELDWTLEYGGTVGKLELSAGALHYDFPNTIYEDTTELFVTAALDVPASPSVGIWKDTEETEGTYLALGVGHEIELPRDLTLELGATLGYGSANNNESYCGVNESAFTDVALTVAVSGKLSEAVSLSASVAWTSLLDDGIRAANTDDDNVVAAATVSWAF